MLIGLTGYAGSGKDTAADHIVKYAGFRKAAFADKLRELAYAFDPPIHHDGDNLGGLRFLVDRYGWDTAKRAFPAVREALQNIGMAHREVFGTNFWVDQVLPQPNSASSLRRAVTRRTVVTDVRFPNEAARVRALGGTVIRIEREGVGPVNGHVSEQPIWADHTVQNVEGGVQAMYFAIDEIVKQLEEK